MKTLHAIAVLLLLLLSDSGPAQARSTWSAEEMMEAHFGAHLGYIYSKTQILPTTWEEMQARWGPAVYPLEKWEILKRTWLLCPASGSRLAAISLHPRRPKNGKEEEWGVMQLGVHDVAADRVPDSVLRQYPEWPRLEQLILARRAEIAAGPAGVAPPTVSRSSEEVEEDDEDDAGAGPAAGKPTRYPVRSVAAVSGAGAPRGWPLGPTAVLAAVVLALAGYLAWRRAH